MTSRVTEIIVDSRDPLNLAKWRAEVLNYQVATPAPEGWVGISPWATREERPSDNAYRAGAQVPTIVFVPVPEAKTVKNRTHLDIWSIDRTRDEEVAWLVERGARRVDIGQGNVSWVVMADPEGNEFCVLG
ncbi:MAG TPA: VOC family protein [Candidatus Dormibacteraeota bacterium]|nr:VOC family protein [Candidatus Dormibacteraeota bacterium]